MFYNLVKRAREIGASDLHLSAGGFPMVRVDGDLHLLNNAGFQDARGTENDLMVAEAALYYGNRLDRMAIQGIVEKILDKKAFWSLQKQGEIDLAWEDDRIGRCRINIYKEGGSYALAVRLINKRIPDCEKLGIPETVQKLVDAKNGLILVTGPTGSGKSTTLAALIQKLNKERSFHIITLEDPVEYIYPLGSCVINQREVGVDTNSFANGLRNALREDPDVILVGELRDAEALRAALQAAETGHLVLSTLHTRDAVTTVNRIIDMLPNEREQVRSQLADSLIGIVSQELHKCKHKQGRIVAQEILINNNAVANLIREGRTHQIYSYLQTGNKLGMQTMEACLADLKKQDLI